MWETDTTVPAIPKFRPLSTKRESKNTSNDLYQEQQSKIVDLLRSAEYYLNCVTRNLIDISSTREVDRILPEHVEEREREYRYLHA